MRALILTVLLSFIAISQSTWAQDDKEPLPTADEILTAVDARLYRASSAGLKAFRFRMSMAQSTGIYADDLKDVYFELAFQAPKSWRYRLLGADGKELKEKPESLANEQGERILKKWSDDLRGISQHFLLGLSWHDRYRNYYKNVHRYLVNNKVEYRLTMNPKSKSEITTVVLKIASGLPREITQVNAKGSRYVARYHFEEREELDGKFILKGTKHELDNLQILEESYDYLTRKGFVLLAKVTRLVTEGDMLQQFFSLEELEVNPEFPLGYFEVEAPTSKPSDGAKKDQEAEASESK